MKDKKAELGYWLANNYRGNGYMMEAVRLLEQELFKNGFNKIIIRNDVLNKGSVNVAKNLGYELEGVLKQDNWLPYENRFRDTNCFAKFKHKN
jgi:RimJ/RimL family protein N-acetyltransferase